jgi:gamma-glutamyltranspeptidase / glutathione hydrolase
MNRLRNCLRTVATACLCLVVVVTGCAGPTVRTGAGEYARAVVAADHVVASQAGASILAMGGNAVDAAVATSFALSVTRPYSCGIGGGGFMVIHFNDDPVHGTQSIAINYREMAPAAVGPDYYVNISDKNASTLGGRAVGVPGSVAGLLYALETYGTLDRKAVMAPAIRAATDGFEADQNYASAARATARLFKANPAYKERFAYVWTTLINEGNIEPGDVVRLPEQARALELISEHGAAAFYEGEIADAIVRTVQGDGGVMTRADLASFRVEQVEPLSFQFGEWRVLGMPPPSSGGLAMAQTLGLLERHLESISDEPVDAALYIHAVVEAMKHAFADRAEWLGDPNFVDVPIDGLLDDAYLNLNASMFDPNRTHAPEAYGSRVPPPDDSGTSHFSVVDRQGNAVACTETINLTFGSKLPVAGFGFCLNDQLDDFTARPGVPNAFGLTQSERNLPAPGKRPLSSMSPTIVLDGSGEVAVVAGAAGGPRIITSTLEIVLEVLLSDSSAAEAMGAARFHHQWSPDVLYMEGEWFEMKPEVVERLKAMGHTVKRTGGIAAANLIRRGGKGWDASGDPRKGGIPAGY